MGKEKKTRITLDLSAKYYQRLEALEDLMEASSKAEVIRDALRLYEYLYKKVWIDGEILHTISPDGKVKELPLFGP